jgi:hypothetical protein
MSAKQSEVLTPEPTRAELLENANRLYDEMERLVKAANKSGDAGQLVAFLEDHPEFSKHLVSLSVSIKNAFVERLVSGEGTRAIVLLEYERKLKALKGDDADPLERLLIERMGICWLRLNWCENYAAGFMRGEVNMRESEYADRLYDRAFKRFTKACESLAKLRALRAMTGRRPAGVSPLRLTDKTG